MQKNIITACLAAGCFFFLAPNRQALAQMSMDLITETSMSSTSALMTSHINNLEIDNIVRGKAHHGGRRGINVGRPGSSKHSVFSTAASTATARNVATTYAPSAQITNGLRDDLIAKVKVRSPQEAQALATVFRQHNFVTVWQGLVAPYGLKTNDVADALTSFLVLGWIEANGKTNATASQVAGVRAQVKAALSDAPSFARLSSANRQKTAEAMMLQFVLQQGAFQKVQKSGDHAQSKRLGEAYQAQVQRAFRLDLRSVALTEGGFHANG